MANKYKYSIGQDVSFKKSGTGLTGKKVFEADGKIVSLDKNSKGENIYIIKVGKKHFTVNENDVEEVKKEYKKSKIKFKGQNPIDSNRINKNKGKGKIKFNVKEKNTSDMSDDEIELELDKDNISLKRRDEIEYERNLRVSGKKQSKSLEEYSLILKEFYDENEIDYTKFNEELIEDDIKQSPFGENWDSKDRGDLASYFVDKYITNAKSYQSEWRRASEETLKDFQEKTNTKKAFLKLQYQELPESVKKVWEVYVDSNNIDTKPKEETENSLVGKEIGFKAKTGSIFYSTITDIKEDEFIKGGFNIILSSEVSDQGSEIFLKDKDLTSLKEGKIVKLTGLDVQLKEFSVPSVEVVEDAFSSPELFVKEYEGYLVGKSIDSKMFGKTKIEKVSKSEDSEENFIEIKTKEGVIYINRPEFKSFIDGEEIIYGEDELKLILQEEIPVEEVLYEVRGLGLFNEYYLVNEIENNSQVKLTLSQPGQSSIKINLSKSDYEDLKKGKQIEYEKGWYIKIKGLIKESVSDKKFNKPDYNYYVIRNNTLKIVKGFRYKEDATMFSQEERVNMRATKVLNRFFTENLGINPEENSSWETTGEIDTDFIQKYNKRKDTSVKDMLSEGGGYGVLRILESAYKEVSNKLVKEIAVERKFFEEFLKNKKEAERILCEMEKVLISFHGK